MSNQDRVLVLVPKKVLNQLGCRCPEAVAALYFASKISSITIVEKVNFFSAKVDMCCPCECPHRYLYIHVGKENFERWLTSYMVEFEKVFDSTEV